VIRRSSRRRRRSWARIISVGAFAILLVLYDLCACASQPLEIVQCLREIDSSLAGITLPVLVVSRKLVSSCLADFGRSTPSFVVRVFGAEGSFGIFVGRCVIYRFGGS
jgi:hypothetical protein